MAALMRQGNKRHGEQKRQQEEIKAAEIKKAREADSVDQYFRFSLACDIYNKEKYAEILERSILEGEKRDRERARQAEQAKSSQPAALMTSVKPVI